MEYKLIIQENMLDGDIFMHGFILSPCAISDAFEFRSNDYHSDCVFILAYSNN